jgi:REP element-mobilizing transposase RayT
VANTYTQLYVQLVFAVQGRLNLINEKYREQLEKYISGIITNKKSKIITIYCNPDHIHILIGIHPAISVSDMVKYIKSSSSKWINEQKWFAGKFMWQEGFGAFTYSKSQLSSIINYILNQPQHHKKLTFKDEYRNFLKKFEINYDEKYLFE